MDVSSSETVASNSTSSESHWLLHNSNTSTSSLPQKRPNHLVSPSVAAKSAFYKELEHLPSKRPKKQNKPFDSPTHGSSNTLNPQKQIWNSTTQQTGSSSNGSFLISHQIHPSEDRHWNISPAGARFGTPRPSTPRLIASPKPVKDRFTLFLRNFMSQYLTAECNFRGLDLNRKQRKSKMRNEAKIPTDSKGIKFEHRPQAFGWLASSNRLSLFNTRNQYMRADECHEFKSCVTQFQLIRRSAMYSNEIPQVSLKIIQHLFYQDRFCVFLCYPPFIRYLATVRELDQARHLCAHYTNLALLEHFLSYRTKEKKKRGPSGTTTPVMQMPIPMPMPMPMLREKEEEEEKTIPRFHVADELKPAGCLNERDISFPAVTLSDQVIPKQRRRFRIKARLLDERFLSSTAQQPPVSSLFEASVEPCAEMEEMEASTSYVSNTAKAVWRLAMESTKKSKRDRQKQKQRRSQEKTSGTHSTLSNVSIEFPNMPLNVSSETEQRFEEEEEDEAQQLNLSSDSVDAALSSDYFYFLGAMQLLEDISYEQELDASVKELAEIELSEADIFHHRIDFV